MLNKAIKVKYDTELYPFAKVLAHDVFKVQDISKLHEVWKRQKQKEKLTYNDNLILRALMQKLEDNSLFYKVYHSWVTNIIAPHFGFQMSYSGHPKMRVHLATTSSVSDFHKDADITKRLDQINCYLPFTDVYDSATLWCESDYNKKDYAPLNLKYGEALLWDGGLLEHGSITNTTDTTRVSCDFRFSPKEPSLVEQPWSEILSGR